MANDIASHFYASLNLPIQERVMEMTRLIEQTSPFRDLQALFPQLVSSVFGGSGCAVGWGLRTITPENNPYEFEALHRFLVPQGPMFRLCYKLLADPQLKYSFPLQFLPLDMQQMLERGRYPQFYADLLNIDAQTIHLVSLSLNPFDYYMFHFACHLLDASVSKLAWEKWSTVYVTLACDYLAHFLPTDPSVVVAPHIPYYTGKAPVVAPLQTTNRQLHAPSLLLIQDAPGLGGQHSPSSTQVQPRNEIWRTETVVQVFIDIWLSIDELSQSPMETHSYTPRKSPLAATSGERVRVARMLVKQVHAFSSKCAVDPAPRSAALRKGARQTLCMRAHSYVVHLVNTWPLDASFRLVLELWLSSIQPWRYINGEQFNNNPERFGSPHGTKEDKGNKTVDSSYTQFIAENLPSYTSVLLQILPRYMRLDLTAPKNAIMLFRLCKVFAQPNLVSMIREIEMAAMGQNTGLHHSNDMNWNMSYSAPEVSMSNKWGAIAKQAIAELSPGPAACYQPMWAEQSREMAFQLIRKIACAKMQAEKVITDIEQKIQQQNQGFWSFMNFWSASDEDDFNLAERKMVPVYLGTAIQQFAYIYGLEDSMMLLECPLPDDSVSDTSHQDNQSTSSHLRHLPPLQIRNKSTNIEYMGDPELIPISSYESTILVRILYQISSRLNEMYQPEMQELWSRQDFWGYVGREVLQPPRTVRTYTRGGPHATLITEDLPPRVSLRFLASYAVFFWLTVGYIAASLFGYGGLTFAFLIIFTWILFISAKATLKMFGVIRHKVNVNPR